MKELLALVGISMGMVLRHRCKPNLASTSHPAENNEIFLADLNKVGIGFGDPAQAINAGQAVCALFTTVCPVFT